MSLSDHQVNIRAGLSRSAKGVPYPNARNIVHVLQHDPYFSPKRIWYDEFLDRVLLVDDNSLTRELRDEDNTRFTVYLQESFELSSVNSHVVEESMRYAARNRSKHVVRDWLTGLKWDGIPRIKTAFEDYWGCADDEYTQCASANFFIGLASRILKPGCKLDTMCVFEGPQGARKSTALEVLGGAWYSASHETVGSKDFLQGMRGKWIIEVAELQSFAKADVRAIKNTLSTRVDDYRKSYGRNVQSYPRECVLAGTTNASDWGNDDSGLRRFWPIQCGDIRLDLLAAAREQLFAEAVAALEAGATWWEMPVEVTAEIQAARQHHDEWTASVSEWLLLQAPGTDITIIDVLTLALKVQLSACSKTEQMRVSRILKLSGYERKKRRSGNFTHYIWEKGENSGPGGNGENDEFTPR